jgi:hypothetical protein
MENKKRKNIINKEEPEFLAQKQYEKVFKKDYNKMLVAMNLNILKELSNDTKQ